MGFGIFFMTPDPFTIFFCPDGKRITVLPDNVCATTAPTVPDALMYLPLSPGFDSKLQIKVPDRTNKMSYFIRSHPCTLSHGESRWFTVKTITFHFHQNISYKKHLKKWHKKWGLIPLCLHFDGSLDSKPQRALYQSAYLQAWIQREGYYRHKEGLFSHSTCTVPCIRPQHRQSGSSLSYTLTPEKGPKIIG